MKNHWVLCDSDSEKAKQLQKELNIHPILCQLLVQRGIDSYHDAKTFFRPSFEHLHDPFLMKGMRQAVERIHKAITQQEKILIYGDYDVDGTTAVSAVYTYFSTLTPYIDYYIPDRYSEGYGVSLQGIDWAIENNVSVIITLDCGITAVDQVNYANTNHIDVIIGDHHLPGDNIPDALACLDPKQQDCDYPYKELSGAGIGFKICEAYAKQYGNDIERVYDLVDYMVISIASDIVPMTGENRVLAYFGLQKINTNPRPGIKAIFDLLEIDRELSVTDLVFIIGPRINAAGRMKHAKMAVEMLIDKGSLQLDEKAEQLNDENLERRTIDREITDEAIDIIANSKTLIAKYSTVVYQPSWHKGVVGIVASRLIENYYKPTIVLTKSNGVLSGSARSVKGFSIYNALKECEDLLTTFGGHKYAAGLSLEEENLPAFQQRFEEVVKSTIEESSLHPEIKIDTVITLADITDKFYNILEQFAPFGPGNMRPVFMIEHLEDAGRSRVINNKHLKLNVMDKNTSYYYDGIGFNLADKYALINKPFDACFTLDLNEWNSKSTIQMKIKDIRPAINQSN